MLNSLCINMNTLLSSGVPLKRKSGRPGDALDAHDCGIECVAVSDNRTTGVSCDREGTLRVWDVAHPHSPQEPGEYSDARLKTANAAAITVLPATTHVHIAVCAQGEVHFLEHWLGSREVKWIGSVTPPQPNGGRLLAMEFFHDGDRLYLLYRDHAGSELSLVRSPEGGWTPMPDEKARRMFGLTAE